MNKSLEKISKIFDSSDLKMKKNENDKKILSLKTLDSLENLLSNKNKSPFKSSKKISKIGLHQKILNFHQEIELII